MGLIWDNVWHQCITMTGGNMILYDLQLINTLVWYEIDEDVRGFIIQVFKYDNRASITGVLITAT